MAPPGCGARAGRYRTAWGRHSPARTSAASALPLLSSAAGAAQPHLPTQGLAVGRAAPAVPAGLALRPAPGAAAARQPARPASLSRSAPAAAAAAGARSSRPRACAGRGGARGLVRAEVSPSQPPPSPAPPLGCGLAARCCHQRAPRAGPLGSPFPCTRPQRSVGEEREPTENGL